jgi:hypothetical protein
MTIARIVPVAAALLGILMLGNGVFMTLAPEPWYWQVPGVPDRGPFNQHFVRDIGILYVLIGLAFAAGIVWVEQRVALWLLPSAWLASHALFHVWEVAVGICGPESMLEDFAGVTLPALIGVALVVHAARHRGT